MQSAWRFFQFRDPEEEAAFQEKQQRSVSIEQVFAFGFFGTVTAVLALVEPPVSLKGGTSQWKWVFLAYSCVCIAYLCAIGALRCLRKRSSIVMGILVLIGPPLLLVPMILHMDTTVSSIVEQASMENGVDVTRVCDPDTVTFFEGMIRWAFTILILMIVIAILGTALSGLARRGYSLGLILNVAAAELEIIIYLFCDTALPVRIKVGAGVLSLGFCVLCPIATGVCASLGQRREFHAQFSLARDRLAAQVADSILNHTLKNTMGDAAGMIGVYLDDCPQMAEEERNTLVQKRASLWRGMRS